MFDINIISLLILLIILLSLIVLGFFELRLHLNSIGKIPIRIHVNGIRGKSSVVRLIAAGLREGGLKTFAKTTGTTPAIINSSGNDVEIHRLRSATIGEQIKLIRYFAKQSIDALVIECMAVNPQYQWISEHRIIRSTLGVITNVRRDHLDEMGTTENQIAQSIGNTIPNNSIVVTSEDRFFNLFQKIAQKRNSTLKSSDLSELSSKYLTDFPYIEHPDNIALALKVCEEIGIKKEIALKGMLKTNPDPGALIVMNLNNKNKTNKFISAFAANDPDSTLKVWKLLKNKMTGEKCIFLNTRDDRRYRTVQLINLIYKKIKPDLLIIRGDNVKGLIKDYENDKIKTKLFDMNSSSDQLVEYITNLDNHSVVGIGNIVGWGESFLDKLQRYSIND